jgi:hypothetical protein
MAALPYEYADLAAIARTIERSPIRVAGLMPAAPTRPCELPDLPTAYDLTDVIILDWIASEVARVRRSYLPL